MRINYFVIICFLLCLLVVNCVRKDPLSEYSYVATRCDEGIIVDGVLEETAWKNAEALTLKRNKTGEAVENETIMTWTKTCHDGQNLYIAFSCNDPDIWSNYTKRDEHLWKHEVVEVFIDTDDDPNTYVEIEVSPRNILFDSYIVVPTSIDVEETARFDLPGIKTAVQVDGTLNNRDDVDKKWTVEIAIPFKDLVENVDDMDLENTEWKINYYRINKDRDGDTGGYAWSPTYLNFHVPSKFGILKFEN